MSQYLTEPQIVTLRVATDELPGRVARVPVYPEARRKRGMSRGEQSIQPNGEGAALPTDAAVAGSDVRIWSFWMRPAATTRATAVSPGLTGPAIVEAIMLQAQTMTAGTAQGTVQLIWDTTNAGEGSGQAESLIVPGTRIFEFTRPAAFGFSVADPGLLSTSALSRAGNNPGYNPLNYRINAPTFYLKLTVDNVTAGAVEVLGYVVVRRL